MKISKRRARQMLDGDLFGLRWHLVGVILDGMSVGTSSAVLMGQLIEGLQGIGTKRDSFLRLCAKGWDGAAAAHAKERTQKKVRK